MDISRHDRLSATAANVYALEETSINFNEMASRMVQERRDALPKIRVLPIFATFAEALKSLRSNSPFKRRNSSHDRPSRAVGTPRRSLLARAYDAKGNVCIYHATKGWRREQAEIV